MRFSSEGLVVGGWLGLWVDECSMGRSDEYSTVECPTLALPLTKGQGPRCK